jgi:hypothetical protein
VGKLINLLFPIKFGELLVETSGGWWGNNEPVGRLAKATFIRISIHLYSSNVVTRVQTQLGK